MSPVDFSRHSDDYAAYRPGFPESFYDRLDGVSPIAGSHTLDLATGPGTVALELAARGGSVVGLDVAEGQITTARRVAEERRLADRVSFQVGRAEATGLAADSFDRITAGQCWHWFDGEAVLSEVRRVLRPGGLLAIAEYSYLAEHSAVARETEALILERNPGWTMAGWSGMFPERVDTLLHAGFDSVQAFCYHHDEEFSHARWRGRMRTCNGVGSGGLPPTEVERFDEALRRHLEENHPDPILVPHRVWCVAGRKVG